MPKEVCNVINLRATKSHMMFRINKPNVDVQVTKIIQSYEPIVTVLKCAAFHSMKLC